jgi:hypothetical protein
MERETNKTRILKLLTDAQGSWVGGSAVMAVGGSRFGGRIEELREAGYKIEGKRNERYALWDYRLEMIQEKPLPPALWKCTGGGCHYQVAMVIPTIADNYGTGYCPEHGKSTFRKEAA